MRANKIGRGKLIVIEGTDGSGKETQSLRLRDRFHQEGFAFGMFSFPRYETPIGNVIKRYLGKSPYRQEFGPANEVDAKIASTWFALDRLTASPEIESMLDRGISAVCNRYVESNMAHQGGKIKDKKERNELIRWLEEFEHNTLKIPRADLVVFLYMPYKIAEELREKRVLAVDGHEGNPEHLMNAERTYLELADRFNWKRINCAPDGTRSSLKTIEQIGDEVYSIVSRALQNT